MDWLTMTVGEWVGVGGFCIAVTTAFWAISKDKVASDLNPKLEPFFVTKKELADLVKELGVSQRAVNEALVEIEKERRMDQRMIEGQISSVAEHKARAAVGPLEKQLASFEKELNSLSTLIDRQHTETREDLRRVFEAIGTLSRDLAQKE